jgi:hypothetical protein
MRRMSLLAGAVRAAALGACSTTPAPEAVPPQPPLAVGQADICAVAARPEAPGMDQTDHDEALAARKNRILETARWQSVAWRYDGPARRLHGAWGECPTSGLAFSTLSFSDDGRYAVTYGGWQSGPLSGGWGHCLFEKAGERWELIACDVTDVS